MFKSIRAYINRIRTSLFGRMERMKESSKRMAFERKRKTLRRFLRNGLRVENLEGRALMAVDMNVINSPMAITMNAENDTATISRLQATPPYPASLMVQTNTADPDGVSGDETYTFIRTAGTGGGGITVSDVDPETGVPAEHAGQVLTIGGDLAISNPKGTDRAIASFTVTGIETINLDQSINVSGNVSGDANTVNVDDPGKVAQAVSLVKAAGTVNIDAGTYSDGEVTVNKEDLTIDVPFGVDNVSFLLGSANNITLTGDGNINVTGNGNGNIIEGNEGANELNGGAGDDTLKHGAGSGTDTLNGGEGYDVAVFDGDFEDYTLGYEGALIISDLLNESADYLTGIEKIQFNDKDVFIVDPESASYPTIASAIDAAEPGDVVYILPGTYNEALVINKEIHLIGSDSLNYETIITPISNNPYGSKDGIWFGLGSNGSSIESLSITGATNGIQIQESTESGAVSNLTIHDVEVTGNTNGLIFRDSSAGTTGMVSISDCTFSDNGAAGISFPSTGSFAGVSIWESWIENNGVQGFVTGGAAVASVSIGNTNFSNNGTGAQPGHGDLILFSFSGNANLGYLIFAGDGTGGNALQITGPTDPNSGTEPDPRKAVVPVGTVSMEAIDINGSYGRDVVLIGRYTDLVGLTISTLTIDATQGVNPGWAQLAMDNVGGDIDLSNYGLADSGLRVRMISNNGVDFASATDYTSGATLTGGSGSDGLLGYTLGDTLSGLGGVDYLAGNAGDDTLIGGAGDDIIDGGTGTDTADFSGNFSDYTITFSNDGKVIVTGTDGADTVSNVEKLTFDDKTVWVVGSSVGSALTTIGAAVTVASAGDIVLVTAGTYTENVTVDKAVTIQGPFANAVGTDGSRSAAAGTGEANIVGRMVVQSNGDVTISGLRFVNNSTSLIYSAEYPSLQRVNPDVPGGDHTYSNNIFYSSVAGASVDARAISFAVLGAESSTLVKGNYITGDGNADTRFGTARWGRGVWSDGGGNSSITLENNFLEFARTGVNLDVADNASYVVTNNTIKDSGSGISFGINAAAHVDSITGTIVNNVGTDFNFQNIADPVTLDLTSAVSNTVPPTETVLVYGGKAGDNITGGPTIDIVRPNSSLQLNPDVVNDTGDTVNLGLGDDILEIQDSRLVSGDSYNGGDGSDTIVFTSTTAAQNLELPAATSNFENAWISTLAGVTTGTTSLSLDASAVSGGLSIKGNDGANTLKGSQGNDTINGNAGDDVIQGNEGDDTIDGGTGSNTAVFPGVYADYEISLSPAITVKGKTGTPAAAFGTDTLSNIQFLQFNDQNIPLTQVATTATISAAAITYGSSATITVTIARESGTPLPGGTVSLVVGTADPIEAQLDANGVATFTVPGLAAGSYDLSATYDAQGLFGASSDTETLTVNTKTLTVSGALATNRAYDGTLVVTVSGGELVGVVDGDNITLTDSGTGTMLDANVGDDKSLTVTGYSIGGTAASNYTLTQPTSLTVDISAKALTVTGATATDRIYNATTTVTVSGGNLQGIVGDDEVSLVSSGSGTGTMDDKNVGTDKSVTVTGYAIEGAGASNYSLTQPTGVTVDISAKTLTVFGADATDRVYNASTTVDVSGGTLAGIESGDSVDLDNIGTGEMDDKNVGDGKSVTVSGYSISGTDAANYSLTQPTGVTVDISVKTLTVSGADATDRVYNASTTVDVSGGTLAGIESGDSVDLDNIGSGEMDDKNVGDGKSVTVSGYSISGTDAANYSLDQPTGVTVDISAKTLTVSGADATDRVYNATTTVDVSGGTLVGVELGDSVDLDNIGSGEMDDKNVGDGKSVTVSGYSISGTDAANYSLDQPTGVTVDISAKTLTVSGADATDRVYNASTTVDVSGGTLVGVESGDSVDLDNIGSGEMDDKNVGDGKSVTVSGYSISGTDAANYSLDQPTGVTVDISAKTLTVSGADATDRVYNATTTVDVSGGTLVGVESGDSVDLDNIGSGEMDDKNVGDGKSVTVSGYSISGTDAANYSLDQPTGVTVDISVKTLTVSGADASDRVYDATTAVSVSGGSLVGVETGDTVSISDTNASGAMADKNVDTGKSVTVSGYSISGTDSGNYSLTQPTGVTVDITAKSLTGTFTVDNKQYDGTTAATVLTRTANQISGDDVSLDGGTATFDNKNVGTDKTVSLVGATLSGADAANYTIGSVTNTTANVTAISLTGAFTVSATKVYDGNTSATVVTRTIPTGVLSGETVTLDGGTATYSDRHVADGKTVSLSGASLGGADAGNYVLGSVTDTTANITKKDVTGSFTVDPRQYDGTNVAIVASTSITKENNDDVVLLNFIGSGDAATFNNAFVGNGKLVTPKSPVAGNWSLSGAEAGNYNLTAMNTTTANITKRTLTPTVTVNNRVYNGTTAATVNTITSDKLELDDVTVTSTSAAFNDKTAAEDKSVTISGLSLSGSSASQYELASTTATSTATVTKAPLTLNFLVTATKVYDGTDTANITASNLTPPVFGDDAVGITGVVAKYDSKNVGANKPVTIADGYSLTGADAGNYEVTAFSPRTASITAKSLSVTSWAVDNKVYDGTNAATISSGTVFAGLVSGDTVTLGGTATFANKSAENGKVVTLASPSLTGTDGGNYSLSGIVGTVTADITKKTLTPVYSVVDKFFDGNNVATVTLESDDRVEGDVLTISYVSATFADSSIGAGKVVTISDISVSGTDSGNYELDATSQTLTASIKNNPPVVTTSSGNTPYFLGNVTVIDPAIVVDDFESTYAVEQDPNSPLSLGGGSMTVSVTENQGLDDYLLISPQGSDAGQIGIDEGTSEVTYGGVVIGTYAGGYESPLVITFGSAANLQSVQALARRIAFSNSNMETTIEARTVSFVVNDGVDSSDAATKSVTINASNQPPVLTPSAGSTNYTEGSGSTIAAPVRVDNLMTVSDTDQLNFDTGVLTVSLGATGTADDRLSIISSNSIGAINVSGSSVRIVTGNTPSLTIVEIGTFTGGTSGSDPLVVTLNAEATVARTQLLVRAVGFQNVSDAPSTAPRSVEFQLSDGFGATSSPVTKTVTVTATNDLPVVVLSDSTPTFTEPTGPTTDVEALPVAELIDNGVSISDPDNPASFNGGNVTVTIVGGGIATSDKFGIRQIGGITVSGAGAAESVDAVATATVSHDGVVFGTISLPTNAMRITLNSESTLERVQALARALTVRNTSDLPGGNRSLRVQVTDNASGVSAFVTKTVTVVATNDIPRISGAAATSQNISRTAASATSALGSSVASFVDPFANDAPSDMNGGTLTMSMKKDGNTSANVQLSVASGGFSITLSGNDIIHTSGGVATTFGTITSANPVSGGDLTITFNANANATRITALLKQLRVRAVSGATIGSHVLTVTLTEPDTDTVSITRPFNVT